MMSPQVICSFLKCHVLQWCGIPSVLSPRWEVIVGCPCHDGDQTPRSHSHNGLKDNKHSLLLWPPDLLSWYQARSTTGLGPCWFSYGSQLCWSQSHSPHNHPKVNFSKFFDQPIFLQANFGRKHLLLLNLTCWQPPCDMITWLDPT